MTEGSKDSLLTAEETQALLLAMKQAPAAPVRDAQLVTEDRTLAIALERARTLSPELSRDLGKVLLKGLGCPITFAGPSAELVTFKAVAGNAAATVAFRVETGDPMYVTLGRATLAALLDRLLGGPLPTESSERGPLSRLERAVLQPAVEPLGPSFCRHWGALPRTAQFDRFVVHGGELSSSANDEIVLCIRFGVRIGTSLEDECTFLIPQVTLSTRRDAGSNRRVASSRRSLVSSVLSANVELIGVLGEAQLTLGTILRWQKGELIRLQSGPTDPITVRIEDRVFLRGTPVVARGNYAVEVSAID